MKGNFESLINENRPVVVDFHALWCGPCKFQSPILRDLAIEQGENIRVIKIDVDQNPELAKRYNIQGVPTLMVFKNGKIVWRHSGVVSKKEITTALTQ
jgi:thioredoxin 1